jgi:hypothetical protein
MSGALFGNALKSSNPTIQSSTRNPRSSGAPKPSGSGPGSASCPATSADRSQGASQGATVSASASETAFEGRDVPISPTTPFLKDVVLNEKKNVESLMKLAAKIGPAAQTVVEEENAYDAAFEAKSPEPIPTYNGTLQGFTFILFFFSYLAISIVMTTYVNLTSGSAMTAGGTFVGFMVLGAVLFALLKWFA